MRSGQWIAAGLVLFVVAGAVRVLSVFRRPVLQVQTAEERPNLILITIDTLRADHLGTYGYPRETSPNIDRLAESGTLFESATVQWPKTNPSMASMMSSTYCTTNAVRNYGAPIDPNLTTLAGIMSRSGYYCASFVANAHLGRYFNFDRGFDEVHELWARRESAHSMGLNYVGTFKNDEIAQLVIDWIAQHDDKPFFLWVHLLDPHGPYEPPEDLRRKFYDDELYRVQDRKVSPTKIPPYQKSESDLNNRLADFVMRYDAEIIDTDRAVGRILDEVDARGLAENTLVILTADHGESLGEHDYYFDHGAYLYESCVRVPLIFSWPDVVPAGRRLDTPVALIDLLPTALELLGIDDSDYRADFQGQSFAPGLKNGRVTERLVFSECKSRQTSVRRGKWKLIDDPRVNPRTGTVQLQLFDVPSDPLELVNVAAENPAVRDKLLAELDAWKDRLDETIGRYRIKRLDPDVLSPEIQEWMRATGYMARPTADEEPPDELTPQRETDSDE